jgi:hypothetical protein
MSYRRRALRQYGRRKYTYRPSFRFAKEFKAHGYRSWRNAIISEITGKLRSASDKRLEEHYEQILGEKPPEFEPKTIMLSEDHAVALVPSGTMNKKIVDDPHLDGLRRGLARIYRAYKKTKRRVKAKPMKYYREKADKDGTVRIGRSRYKAKYVISAIRTLGGDCYLYTPPKNAVLIMENENGDRVFIAPFIKERGKI